MFDIFKPLLPEKTFFTPFNLENVRHHEKK